MIILNDASDIMKMRSTEISFIEKRNTRTQLVITFKLQYNLSMK